MDRREKAQELMREMGSCMPKPFLSKVDKMQRGIGFVLKYLEDASGEVCAGDIAKMLQVSTARIAALLGKMEKQSLITRRTSPTDARRTVVEITPKGTARVQEIREEILLRTELLLEKVGEEDLREFIRISRRIKAALEE